MSVKKGSKYIVDNDIQFAINWLNTDYPIKGNGNRIAFALRQLYENGELKIKRKKRATKK